MSTPATGRPGPAEESAKPAGIAARLLELGEALRSEGVAVGTSELLDAFAVLREIEWTAQADFREALAATLAKSQEDRRIFELVFDRFFFRAVELAAVQEGVREGATTGGRDLDMRHGRARSGRALRGGTRRAAPPDRRGAPRRGGRRDARPRAHGDRRARAPRRRARG